MARKPLIYKVFEGLSKAVEGSKVANTIQDVPCIYLENRPTNINEKVNSFVVIDLPAAINRMILSNRDKMTESNGVMYLFVRAKTDGTSDLLSETKRAEALMGIFPISTPYFVASNPVRIYTGRDNYNFQVTTIRFHLRTRLDADILEEDE